jgi:chromosome segregation ATPase
MRLKLEEDYTQNTKNHEEEVQLRLKFESKLNNMHSAHRDLESKYKRVLSDLTNSQQQIKMLNEKLSGKTDEVTDLKTVQAEHETIIARNKEEIESQRRELNIKSRQLRDGDIRIQQI